MADLIVEFNGIFAIHPGFFIWQMVEDGEWESAESFADAHGLPRRKMARLVKGEIGITSALAEILHEKTGISAQTWLNLQKTYKSRMHDIEMAKREDGNGGL